MKSGKAPLTSYRRIRNGVQMLPILAAMLPIPMPLLLRVRRKACVGMATEKKQRDQPENQEGELAEKFRSRVAWDQGCRHQIWSGRVLIRRSTERNEKIYTRRQATDDFKPDLASKRKYRRYMITAVNPCTGPEHISGPRLWCGLGPAVSNTRSTCGLRGVRPTMLFRNF